MTFYFLLISFISCRKPYAPSAITSPNNYLVVEGVINSGQDSTFIKLSRTVNLSGKTSSAPELGAAVTVEDDQAGTYPVTELGKGNYGAPPLGLSTAHKYRLEIKTTDGNDYVSDYEPIESNPPIDSIGFNIQANGIQLYVNTHNPQNNTRYYRWDYMETWQFHAKYFSGYITNGTEIVARNNDQLIYSCFASDTSSTIVLGSSAKLSQDVIYQAPLTQVAATAEKLETRYSILVKQYALTTESYNFWVNLKKNTEQLGSIFDAEPSNINGNIHCISNSGLPVIGYISVTDIQQKRIFISNAQLPLAWQPTYPYECEADTFYFTNPKNGQHEVAQSLIPLSSSIIPIDPFSAKGSFSLDGYLGSSIECVDCTIRGTKLQPAFWK